MASLRGLTRWGADTEISMPVALRPEQIAYVDMGGFTFTEDGIAHNVREADLETYQTPPFAPSDHGLAGEVR